MNKIHTFRDCKYNTSKSAHFDGYCDLPKYTNKRGRQLVKCQKCPCPDFELEGEDVWVNPALTVSIVTNNTSVYYWMISLLVGVLCGKNGAKRWKIELSS